jgi:tetratricopeptide (TPR) repeat protein
MYKFSTWQNPLKINFIHIILLTLFTSSFAYADESIHKMLFQSAMYENIKASGNKDAQHLFNQAKKYYLQGKIATDNETKSQYFRAAINTMQLAGNLLIKPSSENLTLVSHQTKKSSISIEQFTQKQKAITSMVEAHQLIAEEKNLNEYSNRITGQVNELIDYANGYFQSGQFNEAKIVLNQAYKLITTSVTSLRAGETLKISLNFQTPKDEYVYYLEKISAMLDSVELFGTNKASQAQLMMLTKIESTIKELLGKGQSYAANGDYVAAVKLMEQAFTKMNSGLIIALH